MDLEKQKSIDSNQIVGYQTVTDRLHKKMSVKFRRETEEVVFHPDNKERLLFRSNSKNRKESDSVKGQENSPKLQKQNSMNKMNIYSNAVNVPPFIKENGFLQRKKTFEAFVKDGDKLLKNKDEQKNDLLEKIEKKMNRIKYISNNDQNINDEIIYQEYRRLNSNKSNGVILTNQFWSKKYYDYIIKRSKVKKDLDQLINKKKIEPTPQLVQKFDNYFMDKFIKNPDEEEILDEFKKNDANLISEFVQNSQKISNSNSQQDIHQNNQSGIKNNISNLSIFAQTQSNSVTANYRSSSPFQSKSRIIISSVPKSSTSSNNQEQLFQRIIKTPRDFSKIQSIQLNSKLNQSKEVQNNQNDMNSEQTSSAFSTSENNSILAGQVGVGQKSMRKSSSQISIRKKSVPALTFLEEQMKEIIAKQENKSKNQYATLDFYLKVVKQIDEKRFSKIDKEMIQDQEVKHNLLKATQNIKHQRSQSQMNNIKNQQNFKFESPYSIQNLNYNYSSRHSLRSRQLQHNEERGSMQSLFSSSNQDRFSSVMLNDEENEKEILIEGMGKLIQTCEQFHHENINIMAVIDKAQKLKDQKKIAQQEIKKQQNILNNLNALIERKEKEKRQQDPRLRMQKNKKSKYYYIDDD